MTSLFHSCLQVILDDSSLSEGAVLYLPSKISHYILFEAVHSSNHETIGKMVANWPHEVLSFDYFFNSLFRKRKECTFKASEFYCITSTIDLPEKVYHSMFAGVFRNVYDRLSQGAKPALKNVDLTNICTNHCKAAILSCLMRGEYPAIPNDDGDLVALNTSTTNTEMARLTLLNIRPPKVPITIHINISFHAKLGSTGLLSLLSVPSNFKVIVSGINITSSTLTSQEVSDILETLELRTPLKVIHINLALITSTIYLPSLQPHGSLWLYIPQGTESQHCTDITLCILGTVKSLKDLIIVSNDSLAIRATLLAVSKNCKIDSLSLLKDANSTIEETTVSIKESMRTSLPCVSAGLEYLQLHHTTLTELPLSTLQQCSKLRVLSIIETNSNQFFRLTNTPSECFKAIASLSCLQYFEWAATCNLRTLDVFALYQLLSTSLPLLQHCHLYLLYILLFTTDLDKEEYKPIMRMLHLLLKDLAGDDSCSMYRFSFTSRKFVHWLKTVHPTACIKCDSIMNYRHTPLQ